MYFIITDLKTHRIYLNKYQFLGLAMLYRFQTRDWLYSDVNCIDSIRRLWAQGNNFVSYWKIKSSSGVQETACRVSFGWLNPCWFLILTMFTVTFGLFKETWLISVLGSGLYFVYVLLFVSGEAESLCCSLIATKCLVAKVLKIPFLMTNIGICFLLLINLISVSPDRLEKLC